MHEIFLYSAPQWSSVLLPVAARLCSIDRVIEQQRRSEASWSSAFFFFYFWLQVPDSQHLAKHWDPFTRITASLISSGAFTGTLLTYCAEVDSERESEVR